MQWWSLLALADLYVTNRPYTLRIVVLVALIGVSGRSNSCMRTIFVCQEPVCSNFVGQTKSSRALTLRSCINTICLAAPSRASTERRPLCLVLLFEVFLPQAPVGHWARENMNIERERERVTGLGIAVIASRSAAWPSQRGHPTLR